jgi:hypothetical protein
MHVFLHNGATCVQTITMAQYVTQKFQRNEAGRGLMKPKPDALYSKEAINMDDSTRETLRDLGQNEKQLSFQGTLIGSQRLPS